MVRRFEAVWTVLRQIRGQMALPLMGCLGFVVLGLPNSSTAKARSENVALTFDDLPALTQLQSQDYVTYANMMLLRGLRRHHLPAIGFVNEGKIDELERVRQIGILRMWLAAGMHLGNHTFSHESLNSMTAAAYVADIVRGEQVTRPLLARHHQVLRWFRHPYLETGSSLAVKQEIESWLAAHGYRIAPVTMENSDWLFSEPYDDAIVRHNDVLVAHIKASYLDYTARMITWHREAAHRLFGRNMSYVMLLHATRLNADCIDDFAALLRKNRLHAVTLGKAMKDPAYRIPDTYSGKAGIGWLERWAMQLHLMLPPKTSIDPPADIVADYDRVDNDRINHDQ